MISNTWVPLEYRWLEIREKESGKNALVDGLPVWLFSVFLDEKDRWDFFLLTYYKIFEPPNALELDISRKKQRFDLQRDVNMEGLSASCNKCCIYLGFFLLDLVEEKPPLIFSLFFFCYYFNGDV